MLPWAVTDNGDALCWLTAGPPDSWPIVINFARSTKFVRYDVGAVRFPSGMLTQDLSPAPFAEYYEGENGKSDPPLRFSQSYDY